MRETLTFKHIEDVPFDERVGLYFPEREELLPLEYTGWRDEVLSWKTTCYLHGSLCPSPTFHVKGPDALKFFEDNIVNDCQNWPVNKGKHGIMCLEDGTVMCDGVAVRLAEDEFETYWMAPYDAYRFEIGNYDAVGEYLTGDRFFFQVAGPTSIFALEKATGASLRTIKFMEMQDFEIAGKPVRILRMGMAGSLAYEIHGASEYSVDVYNAIWEAGQEFGMKKLGYRAYMMNHTEDGFPQAYYHFPYPWAEDKGFADYLARTGVGALGYGGTPYVGSMPAEPKCRYRNIVELGWGRMVKFNHDFPGKEAIKALIEKPNRQMVTLVWDPDDIAEIHRSQYWKDEEPYAPMDTPSDKSYMGYYQYHDDQVLDAEGNLVGISSGRTYSLYYRDMISLACVKPELAAEGTELFVLWGDEGTRQKKIRVTVGRFPYYNEGRNQEVDVTKL
jgi:vanillate/3-O-methylgallate O-demethylase